MDQEQFAGANGSAGRPLPSSRTPPISGRNQGTRRDRQSSRTENGENPNSLGVASLTEEMNREFVTDDGHNSGAGNRISAGMLRNQGPQGIDTCLLRMAAVFESNILLRTQGELYKELNLNSFHHEMLTTPSLGAVTNMLPALYHIFGVTGHIANLTQGATGSQRLYLLNKFFYNTVPHRDPLLLTSRIRVKLSPRLLIVLAFVMFRGPMAFHPSDISVVPTSRC